MNTFGGTRLTEPVPECDNAIAGIAQLADDFQVESSPGLLYSEADLSDVRDAELGGGGGRRRAEVGDPVDDGPVGVVTDAGYDRHAAGKDGAGDVLVVEGRQVFS